VTHTERTAQAIADYKSEDNALIGLCEYLAARCDELEAEVKALKETLAGSRMEQI